MGVYDYADSIEAEPRPIRGWATSDDWDVHRLDIERLYKVENKTLREVMHIMKEQHGFRAT